MQTPVPAPSQPVKLLAIDIDGTLLNPQRQVAPRTLEAIQAAQQAGITVTLATARRYYNSMSIAAELGIAIPLIVCDGALIIQHPGGAVVHTQLLSAAVAQQAVEIIAGHGLQPVVHHIKDGVEETWTGFGEFDNEWVAAYFTAFPESSLRRMHYEICCTGQPDPLRVVVFASQEAVYGLIPEISALDCSWNLTKRGSYGCAELAVMGRGCSKASGVAALAHHLDIPLEQVMAIGDNLNDVEMLQAVGWGVAMGQAPDAVKAIAHAVTASNAEDGVALAIERYALAAPRRAAQAASNSFRREI